MKQLVTVITVGTLGALALLIAIVMTGVVPLPFLDDGDRPPCSQLPSASEVEQAIVSHREFVDAIEASGSGVRVEASSPCGEDDRALVTIAVSSDEERSQVETLLREGAGFGVPAQIVD